MGLMDKVKAQATVLVDKAQTGVQQGQTKLAEMQSGKQADHLLRELGAYVFLSERNRVQPDSDAKVAEIMSQLDALEAAGTPVAITPEAPAVPAAGAVPQSVDTTVPTAGTVPPPPPSGSPLPPPPVPTAGTVPAPGAAGSGVDSAIPRSGGALPGE